VVAVAGRSVRKGSSSSELYYYYH